MASSAFLMLALAAGMPSAAPSSSAPAASPAHLVSSAGAGAVRSAASVVLAAGPTAKPSGDAAPASVGKPSGDAANADASFARGVEALKAKDSQAAIAALSACTQAAPSRVDCHWELGWAYSLAGRWSDALAQWTEVQRLNPEHPELADALAQARGQVQLQAKLAEPSPTAARPPPPAGAKLRIRAVGDVMLGTDTPEGHLPPDGPASVIAGVRPLLQDADLTFANLEGPLCDSGKTTKCRTPTNCYAFRSPTAFGKVLAEAGLDVASTANNHAGDFGEQCRRETEGTLDKLGIKWSGPPGTVATLERNGLKIGLVAFHTSASCNHLNNTAQATALVRSVAAAHDIVIVSFHGGAEGPKAVHVPQGNDMFLGEDRGDLRTFTHAVVDAGADLVLGHGPHVARAVEFYQGHLIAYSMGNFATYGRFNLKGPQALGMVLEVELEADGRFSKARILPTKQEGEGLAVPDPSGAVVKLVRQLSDEDFPATGARVADDGTLTPRAKGPLSNTGAP